MFFVFHWSPLSFVPSRGFSRAKTQISNCTSPFWSIGPGVIKSTIDEVPRSPISSSIPKAGRNVTVPHTQAPLRTFSPSRTSSHSSNSPEGNACFCFQSCFLFSYRRQTLCYLFSHRNGFAFLSSFFCSPLLHIFLQDMWSQNTEHAFHIVTLSCLSILSQCPYSKLKTKLITGLYSSAKWKAKTTTKAKEEEILKHK